MCVRSLEVEEVGGEEGRLRPVSYHSQWGAIGGTSRHIWGCGGVPGAVRGGHVGARQVPFTSRSYGGPCYALD